MIMISGICLGEVQASSCFSCKYDSKITAQDTTNKEDSAYRTEQLYQREVVSSIRQVRNIARRINSKSEFIEELCLFTAVSLPQKFHITNVIEAGSCLEKSCSITILTYIHKQDGEKA